MLTRPFLSSNHYCFSIKSGWVKSIMITFLKRWWNCRQRQPFQPWSRRGATGSLHCQFSSACHSNHRITQSTADSPVEIDQNALSHLGLCNPVIYGELSVSIYNTLYSIGCVVYRKCEDNMHNAFEKNRLTKRENLYSLPTHELHRFQLHLAFISLIVKEWYAFHDM